MVFRRFHREEKEKPVEQPMVTEVVQDQQQQPDDDIDEYTESPDTIKFVKDGQVLRTMQANVFRSSTGGQWAKSRRGIMVSLDLTADNLYTLDLRGMSIVEFFVGLHTPHP